MNSATWGWPPRPITPAHSESAIFLQGHGLCPRRPGNTFVPLPGGQSRTGRKKGRSPPRCSPTLSMPGLTATVSSPHCGGRRRALRRLQSAMCRVGAGFSTAPMSACAVQSMPEEGHRLRRRSIGRAARGQRFANVRGASRVARSGCQGLGPPRIAPSASWNDLSLAANVRAALRSSADQRNYAMVQPKPRRLTVMSSACTGLGLLFVARPTDFADLRRSWGA